MEGETAANGAHRLMKSTYQRAHCMDLLPNFMPTAVVSDDVPVFLQSNHRAVKPAWGEDQRSLTEAREKENRVKRCPHPALDWPDLPVFAPITAISTENVTVKPPKPHRRVGISLADARQSCNCQARIEALEAEACRLKGAVAAKDEIIQNLRCENQALADQLLALQVAGQPRAVLDMPPSPRALAAAQRECRFCDGKI
jgi:hypothetical protein